MGDGGEWAPLQEANWRVWNEGGRQGYAKVKFKKKNIITDNIYYSFNYIKESIRLIVKIEKLLLIILVKINNS